MKSLLILILDLLFRLYFELLIKIIINIYNFLSTILRCFNRRYNNSNSSSNCSNRLEISMHYSSKWDFPFQLGRSRSCYRNLQSFSLRTLYRDNSHSSLLWMGKMYQPLYKAILKSSIKKKRTNPRLILRRIRI